MANTKKEVAMFGQNVSMPAFMEKDAGKGNENIGASDMQISRLDLIQQLSPQIDEDDPRFVEGAQVGHIFDNLTGECYDNTFVINLYMDTRYQVFKKRKFGTGYEGSFKTEDEARAHLEAENLPVEQYDIVQTAIHSCLLLDETGKPKKPVIIYMSGSKKFVSDNWNTAIVDKCREGAPRFGFVWSLQSVKQKNRQGQPYQNFKVDFAGVITDEALFTEAKENYLAITSKLNQ